MFRASRAGLVYYWWFWLSWSVCSQKYVVVVDFSYFMLDLWSLWSIVLELICHRGFLVSVFMASFLIINILTIIISNIRKREIKQIKYGIKIVKLSLILKNIVSIVYFNFHSTIRKNIYLKALLVLILIIQSLNKARI